MVRAGEIDDLRERVAGLEQIVVALVEASRAQSEAVRTLAELVGRSD